MRPGLLVCALTLAAAAAGCAAEAPGQPVPSSDDVSTAPPTPTSDSPTGEAPPINSPELDLTRYEDESRVCDLLTPAQLAPFGTHKPGKAHEGVAGYGCTWHASDSSAGATVDASILSKVREGLAGVYARKDKFAFFEGAGEVNGYPAVHLDTVSDGDRGVCTTVVGVRRDLAVDVTVHVNARSSPEYRTPCSLSDKAASSVIDTVRGGR